jgi:hypothetical protein
MRPVFKAALLLAATFLASATACPLDAATTPQWLEPATPAPFDAFERNDYPIVLASGTGAHSLAAGYAGALENSNLYRAVESSPGVWSAPSAVDSLNSETFDGYPTLAAGEGGDHDHLYFLSSRDDPDRCPLPYRAHWDGTTATSIEAVEFLNGFICIEAIQATAAFGEWRLYFVDGAGHAKYYVLDGTPLANAVSVSGLSASQSAGFYFAPDGSFAIGSLICTITGEPACLEGDWADLFVFLPAGGPAGASWERVSLQTVYNGKGTSASPFIDYLGRLWWNSGVDDFYALPDPADGWCLSALPLYESFADCCPAEPEDCRGPGCGQFDCSDDDDNDDNNDDNDDATPGGDDDDASPNADDDNDDHDAGGCA